MKNALLAVYKDLNEITETTVFYTDKIDFINDTWNPEDKSRVIYTMGFKITGKTYQEKKAAFEEICKDFQAHDVGGLYYSDYAMLGDYFERNARRYGLVTELKENGII